MPDADIKPTEGTMTRQTAEPIEDFRKTTNARPFKFIVEADSEGWLLLEAPYQRGSVWNADQRIALIRSFLEGVPIPAIILNDRTSSAWTGPKPDAGQRNAILAIIDGKQRAETALAWFAGQLAVPASWFPAEHVVTTEGTEDGPYVRYTGLSRPQRTRINLTWTIPFVEAKVESVEREAEIYLLVNGGGTPQTADDMANAARVAEGK